MGIARIRSGGTLKSVVTRDWEGREIERFEMGIVRTASIVAAPLEPLPEPTFLEEIGHAGEALAKWAARGFKVAPPEVRAKRYEICLGCRFWSNKARFGLGKCKHPGCGCTRLKFKFATEGCPIGKWRPVT